MKTILFQGDSITDTQRNREYDPLTGHGYVTMIAGEICSKNPQKYNIINRGISGNRVVDLLARWKSDCINIKPDYLTIMIGINDVWHEIDRQNGVDTEKFYTVYKMIIDEVLEKSKNTKIILMTPYVVHGLATDNAWDTFRDEVDKRIEICLKLAKEYNLLCINTQQIFDDAIKTAPSDYWTIDGVHPSLAGHGLIANEWLKVFNNI